MDPSKPPPGKQFKPAPTSFTVNNPPPGMSAAAFAAASAAAQAQMQQMLAAQQAALLATTSTQDAAAAAAAPRSTGMGGPPPPAAGSMVQLRQRGATSSTFDQPRLAPPTTAPPTTARGLAPTTTTTTAAPPPSLPLPYMNASSMSQDPPILGRNTLLTQSEFTAMRAHIHPHDVRLLSSALEPSRSYFPLLLPPPLWDGMMKEMGYGGERMEESVKSALVGAVDDMVKRAVRFGGMVAKRRAAAGGGGGGMTAADIAAFLDISYGVDLRGYRDPSVIPLTNRTAEEDRAIIAAVRRLQAHDGMDPMER